MNTAHKFLILFLGFFLFGCEDPTSFAWDESNNTPEEKISDNPDDAYNEVVAQIFSHRYAIKDDHNCPNEQYRAHTKNKDRTVYLCDLYYENSKAAQIEILWHELVHVKQTNHIRYNPNHNDQEWTWAYETQAYRQSLIVRNKFRGPVDKNTIYDYLGIMLRGYGLSLDLVEESRVIFVSYFLEDEQDQN